MHVITELVINHTSDQHPWFQRARRAESGSPERDFYVWSETKDRYGDVRIIFQDTETSNWAWDPVAGAYYWHRFFSHQPDLNYENPAVRKAVTDVLDFWFDLGVDGLRLDAVPYLHEREGTNGENLDETHEELKRLRAHVDSKYGDRMLIAEANQWPEESVAYFGDGDECHMAFHFPLMPRLYLAVERENRLPIIDILEQTPEIPENAQWAIFLRNHDELTLEMVSEEEREFMWRTYAPDRRARLNLGIRRRLAPLLENDRRRIELLMSLLLSLPGTPVLYYGDEIGMGDNIFLADRDGVRTPMQWSNDRNAGFSVANAQSLYLPVVVDPQFHYETVNVEAQHDNPNSLLWWVSRMIRRRQRHPVFGRGAMRFLDPDNPHVLAYLREDQDESILVVANLSRHAQFVELDLHEHAGGVLLELLGNTEFPAVGELPYLLTLSPYGFFWFAIESATVSPALELGTIPISGPLETAFSTDQPLPERLARFALNKIWYQGRYRRQLNAEVYEAIPVTAGDLSSTWILLLDVEYVSGSPHRYVMPVGLAFGDEAPAVPEEAVIARISRNGSQGIAYDALQDPAFRTELLHAVAAGRTVLGRAGELICVAATAIPDLEVESLQESSLAENHQGESFIHYGSAMTIKLFRAIEPGINPDLELRRFLTERTSFDQLSNVYGSLAYRSGPEFSVGILQRTVKPGPSAWTVFSELCAAYLEGLVGSEPPPEPAHAGWTVGPAVAPPQPESPALLEALDHIANLAVTTSELHRALASHTEEPDLRPERFSSLYQRSLYQSLRATVRQELAAIRRMAGGVPDEQRTALFEVLGAERAMLDQLDPIRRTTISGQRTRIHGDFRLDEIRLVDGAFHVLDFTGDHTQPMSVRRLKASPLRDVAEMLRSLDYVSVAASQSRPDRVAMGFAAWWYRAIGQGFVDAYLRASEGAPALPASKAGFDALLRAYELTKALREVHWELINRQDWLPVALAGVRRQIGWPPATSG
jgi:maltose alpha-D-glucosyltransferase/alpha-amylase